LFLLQGRKVVKKQKFLHPNSWHRMALSYSSRACYLFLSTLRN
jgi:hypothetical protein